MIVVKHIFSVLKMTNWTRVYLNNFLSLLFQPFFFIFSSEQDKMKDLHFTPIGLFYLILSCLLGTCLAWSGTALRARLSATTFTVVGVACKVVTELANWLMWEKHANEMGLLALVACFVGSLLFVPAQSRSEQNTWFSNAVWNGLNRISWGLLKQMELESPSFSATNGDHHPHQHGGKEPQFVPVKQEEVGQSDLGEDVEKRPEKDPQ